MIHHRVFIAAACALLGATPLYAQSHDVQLQSLEWMTGCWRGTSPRGTVIEEIYTTPTANLMQGLSRFIRDGRVVDFEFTTITPDSAGPSLRPQPRGGTAVRFALKSKQPRAALWENLQHDYPQRIAYSRPHPDTLVARIEGPGQNGTLRFSEWRMLRVACFE